MGPDLRASMAEPPDPAPMTSTSASRSTPAASAAIRACATVDALAAATALLMTLTACPWPSGPAWTMSDPIASKRGRARSKSSRSPPAMIVSVPSSAFGEEPVTGASMKRTPRSASAAPISRAAVEPMVDMSTHSRPGCAAPAASPRTARTWLPSTSIVKAISTSATASRGVAATVAPCSAAHASAVSRVRFHTHSSWPARTRCTAWREPMMPRPSQATFMRSVCQPEPMRDGRRLGARAHVELGQDPRDVDARRLLGHEELGADLAVGPAARHELEDLALARRQAERVLAVDRRGVGGQARTRDQALDLAGQPAGAEPAGGLESGLGEGDGRVAPATRHVRLGRAPARLGGRVRAADGLPRLGGGDGERGVGGALRPRHRRPGLREIGELDRALGVGGGLDAREEHLGLQQRAADLLLVGEVAPALGAVGLDRHADRRHPGQARGVLGAELDAVQCLVDGGARAVEIALAAA